MPAQINLLPKKDASKTPRADINARAMSLFGGSVILFIVIIVVAVGVSIYAYVLQQESNALTGEIAALEGKVESLREVEEKKSILTLKTDALQQLHESRFDYVKAIDDVQKLFAYSLTIDTIELEETKEAQVKATKTGEIVISETEALSTDITELILSLTLPSSEELQETVDNLKSFLGKGLTRADVIESSKLEDNSGYEVNFRLTFGSVATGNEGAIEPLGL